MTNDPEAIRAALVPMGFEFKTEVRSNGRVDYLYLEFGGDPESHIDWHMSGGLYEEPLTDFLNDKAQTGARIADLAHVDIEHCVGGWRVESYNGAEQARFPFDGTYYETSDEAIAALWLRVKGLDDPREAST